MFHTFEQQLRVKHQVSFLVHLPTINGSENEKFSPLYAVKWVEVTLIISEQVP